jgi:hypothetical protein
MFKAVLISCALGGALAATEPSYAQCVGDIGPGGPCSIAPGGGLSIAPGGGLSIAPGGGLSIAPGGGLSIAPGGGLSMVGPSHWRRIPGY